MSCKHKWSEDVCGYVRWFCKLSQHWTVRRAYVQQCDTCKQKRMRRYGVESLWDIEDYQGQFPPEQNINNL